MKLLRPILLLALLVNGVYTAHALDCTEIAVDAVQQFDMTGKERLYPGQILQREVGVEGGSFLSMLTTNEADDARWELLKRFLCNTPTITTDTPILCVAADEPAPSQPLWYGPAWRY